MINHSVLCSLRGVIKSVSPGMFLAAITVLGLYATAAAAPGRPGASVRNVKTSAQVGFITEPGEYIFGTMIEVQGSDDCNEWFVYTKSYGEPEEMQRFTDRNFSFPLEGDWDIYIEESDGSHVYKLAEEKFLVVQPPKPVITLPPYPIVAGDQVRITVPSKTTATCTTGMSLYVQRGNDVGLNLVDDFVRQNVEGSEIIYPLKNDGTYTFHVYTYEIHTGVGDTNPHIYRGTSDQVDLTFKVEKPTYTAPEFSVADGSIVDSGTKVNITAPGATSLTIITYGFDGLTNSEKTYDGEKASVKVDNMHRRFIAKSTFGTGSSAKTMESEAMYAVQGCDYKVTFDYNVYTGPVLRGTRQLASSHATQVSPVNVSTLSDGTQSFIFHPTKIAGSFAFSVDGMDGTRAELNGHPDEAITDFSENCSDNCRVGGAHTPQVHAAPNKVVTLVQRTDNEPVRLSTNPDDNHGVLWYYDDPTVTLTVNPFKGITAQLTGIANTGVSDIETDNVVVSEYYTLQGIKLPEAPTVPGIYVEKTSTGNRLIKR